MQKSGAKRRYSASDLVNFAACAHLTTLDLVNLETPLPKAVDSEEMELIAAKGFAHEATYWQHLKREHKTVVDLAREGATDGELYSATREALSRGDDVLFQATLLSDPWVGHADFLTKVDTPSALGPFSYEVADTKLARTSQAKFLVQLCLYSEMLAEVQGVMPKRMHVVLGDGRRESFVVEDYLRYFRRLKERFLLRVTADPQPDTYPERVDRCGNCRWRDLCAQRWENDDHLNRVAGISRTQIAKLRDAGVATTHALASAVPDLRVPRIQPDTLRRLAHQARLQVQSLESGQPVVEVLPLVEGKGFNRLPEPDEADLFFDMEGNPLEDGGLEYLFGVYLFEAGQPIFKAFWAHTRDEERLAFEQFIDFVTQHLRLHPRAHIYHYAPYEPTALKRLMSSHGTRETEVDNLLRHSSLVDLYAVVREGIRVGEGSYSIKSIERFYSTKAREGVKSAGASIVYYERWKATSDAALLRAIEEYNLDDVRSTYELRQWLLSIRPAGTAWRTAGQGTAVEPKPAVSAKAQEAAEAMEEYRRRLVGSLSADRLEWTNEHRVCELLFHLLGFHRRCDKPGWWALFARQQASEEELLDDLEALAGLTQLRPPTPAGGGTGYCYAFPEQETKLKTGDSCTLTELMVEVENVVIDEDARVVTFDTDMQDPLPSAGLALGAGQPISSAVIQGAIRRFVDAYLAGKEQFSSGLQFLRREIPRVSGVASGGPLLSRGEPMVGGTSRVASNLLESYLFVQGPPGAGKTYTGSHVIVDLLKAGKRIAVTSNSHKAINNLLQAVEKVASQAGSPFRGAKKSTSDSSRLGGRYIEDIHQTPDIVKRLKEFQLVAGTAWLFSSAKLEHKFDYLFVDEAGQVSLANLIAMSTCAKNIVLLGDQMQLGQPIQGVHPGESGKSVLDYLLEGEPTIAPERGVFLKDTWRMHPDVCRFISDAVYSGRLEAEPQNANQRLVVVEETAPAIRPTGISFIAVSHDGCSQRSDEEAERIRALYAELLTLQYADRDGVLHQMDSANILVVAPYNMQVTRLMQVLPADARVGTVDKFQGQEAEAVLVSMTTSSGEYLPRDIDFLYSKNRLNVAISRARCWVGVVASPRLLDVSVATPTQMGLVNTLCWVSEYANK